MGFGSYETAWTWLHKLRASMVRKEREPLRPFVQVDETLVGEGGPNKELVLVATEAEGRVRLAHAANNDEATLKRFADGQIAPDAEVTTDGLASYNERSLGERPHEPKVQTKVERREKDALQGCHWTISLLKRWLLGTHAGAVRRKHLQAYLDEFAFRHNRRKTNGTVRIAARVIEGLVAGEPLPGAHAGRGDDALPMVRRGSAGAKPIGMPAYGLFSCGFDPKQTKSNILVCGRKRTQK